MNITQRKYLLKRIEEESQIKRTGAKNSKLKYWDATEDEANEVVAAVNKLLETKFPKFAAKSHSFELHRDYAHQSAYFNFQIGPTRDEKQAKDSQLNRSVAEKYGLINKEAKKVSDVVMLGDETYAMELLKEFMEKDFNE